MHGQDSLVGKLVDCPQVLIPPYFATTQIDVPDQVTIVATECVLKHAPEAPSGGAPGGQPLLRCSEARLTWDGPALNEDGTVKAMVAGP